VARRERKRAKRYAEAARWWVGGLSPAQEAIVQSATATMPDTAPAWEAYRRSRQAGLLRLLREGAREDKIRSYLTDWLADHDDLPAGLAQAGQGIRDAITELVVRLGASFSAEQEALLLRRLRGLREDFLALQAKPRFAGPGCK
jgi:hypothetical protein